MPAPQKPAGPARSTLFINAFAISLAGPLLGLALFAAALLLLGLGVLKLLSSGADTQTASAQLLGLATGGIIAAPWGGYLIGAVQIALGLGLLVPPSRGLAGLGCLLLAVAVAIGGIIHRASLTAGAGLNETGLALVMLLVLLVAAAALGTRSAARRTGTMV